VRAACSRGDDIASVPEATVSPKLTRNRVGYQHGEGLQQYLVNGPLGVEQGFVLAERPRGQRNSIVLVLSVDDALLPTAVLGASEIAFYTPTGEPWLHYTDLFAHDAAGHQLDAWMTVRDASIWLHVDDSGAFYPLTVDPLVWAEQQKLVANDGAEADAFGSSVSLDGNTALVGTPGDNDKGSDSGSAYVFVRSGAVWADQQKLVAIDGAKDDSFGHSVSLGGDTALIGAWRDDDKGYDSGSAYVFVRSGSVWAEQQKLIATDGAKNDRFGYSLSVSGNTALVGAYADDDKGSTSGSAYVFLRSGGVWTAQQKLVASDGAVNDQFGYSVSLSADTALVGAYTDDDNGADSGSAYVFLRVGNVWTEQQKLVASDGSAGDNFGGSVSLTGDTALVAAPRDGSDSGSAYVFVRKNGVWTPQGKLVASDGASQDYFGFSVSANGEAALVGAIADDDKGASSGSAYVFVRNGSSWAELDKVVASDGATQDSFGISVSLNGDTALIGAYSDDDNGLASGSAYVLIAAGKTCSNPAECSSGYCVDGFCCNSACAGPCAACSAVKTGGIDGVCQFFDSATDPDAECPVNEACNGAGACKKSNGQPCNVQADCVSERCVDAVCCGLPCGNLCEACSAAKTGGSDGTCGPALSDSDPDNECGIGPEQSCDGAGACKLTKGQTCTAPSECVSGNCIDAVCCDSPCVATCYACSAAKTGGSDGMCAFVLPSLDPDDECGTGSDLSCDGFGACKKADGQVCAEPSECLSENCVSGLCCNAACTDSCDKGVLAHAECSTGTCKTTGKSCNEYLCADDKSCATSCTDHADCAGGYRCEEPNCVPKGDKGDPCTTDVECAKDHCIDQVCCAVDDCTPYRCGPEGACRETCSSSGECASGHTCISSGQCVPEKKASVAMPGCSVAHAEPTRTTRAAWWAIVSLALGAATATRRRRRARRGRGDRRPR